MIRAIERVIWIKTAEMVVELRIRPSVNFLTFPSACGKTNMSIPLLFVLFYQKYHHNRVSVDLFRVVLELRFLGNSTETLMDDVMNMVHTFGLS